MFLIFFCTVFRSSNPVTAHDPPASTLSGNDPPLLVAAFVPVWVCGCWWCGATLMTVLLCGVVCFCACSQRALINSLEQYALLLGASAALTARIDAAYLKAIPALCSFRASRRSSALCDELMF